MVTVFLNTDCSNNLRAFHALSGRIGKMVASQAGGCRVDSRPRLHLFILCKRRSGGTAHEGGGNGQLI